jgi:serine protease Do
MCPARIYSMIIVLLLSVPLCGHGDDGIDASRRTALVNAIEKAAPAVVTINVVEYRPEDLMAPFFRDFWSPFYRPQRRKAAVESTGSGFIIDRQGHILTNYHVIEGAARADSVILPDGRTVPVELTGYDTRTDLAVLRMESTVDMPPPVPAGSSADLLIGEWVIAIGNPFGTMIDDPQPSVSVGVVSARNRRVNRAIGGGERLYQNMIQTDAAINPGNSGGPLINARGQAIGVNTMIFSKSGGHQGLGFAIPIDRAKRVAEEIIRYGRRRDPWLGFHGRALSELDRVTRQRLGIRVDEGVIVTELLRRDDEGKEIPAWAAGLRPGDVIVAMNGAEVRHPIEVDFINWELFIGDTVKLTASRQGQEQQLTFRVREITVR